MNKSRVEAYATWLRSWGASATTVASRTRFLSEIEGKWGDPRTWTSDDVRDYMGRDLKAWSRATYFANFTCVCGWLYGTGQMPADIMEGVRKPKSGSSVPHPLTDNEVESIMAVASQRQRDWLTLSMHAGLRAHEIAKIRGEDVTPDTIFVIGKGNVQANLPVNAAVWAVAQRYPRRGYWFPSPTSDGPIRGNSISSSMGTLFRRAGVSGSVHRGRHTYATRLLRAGVNIRVVQKLMRHGSLSTTANYTAVDENELRAGVDTLVS